MEKKSLDLNLKKSGFLVMGSKGPRNKIMKEVEKSPLKPYGKNMQDMKALKYLGDYLVSSLEESVHETVRRRVAVARQTIHEIRHVVEDTRAEKLGAVALAFDIFSQAIVPMVTHNAETWVNMTRKTERMLMVFSTPSATVS